MILRRLLMGMVRAYQLLISPMLGGSCRFEPTCSAYALQALDLHGAAAGSYLALRRIARCQPWCDGGHDPVPSEKPRLFSKLLSPTTTKKSS
jgi:putative membrane protein insertion efficiency factor